MEYAYRRYADRVFFKDYGEELIFLRILNSLSFRYSGKPAAALRGFKALYMGLFMNTIIMGWVNLAMTKILVGMFPNM